MKTTCFVVVMALGLGAAPLRAQNDANSSSSSVSVSAGQTTSTVIVNGSPAGGGGSQSFTVSAAGTNGFDANAFSKAIQDGMKQAFGNGASNLLGGGGGGVWDPKKMMQQFNERALENVRDGLGFTDDAEWSAVRPLVENLIELQQKNEQAAQQLRSRRFFGANNPFMKNFGAAFKAQESPEQTALQQAVDDNAPAAQVRDAIAKFRAAQKEQQAKLEAAQANLRKVLTAKQEAQAILLGLLN